MLASSGCGGARVRGCGTCCGARPMGDIRPAAVAGTWYPANADELAARGRRAILTPPGAPAPVANLVALIAPHAGLMYSGPVAAHAYRQLRDRAIDTLVLVGPSHFVAFDGVALYAAGGFGSPLGVAQIDEVVAADLLAATPVVHEDRGPHRREHSLEMQLPFVRRVAPERRSFRCSWDDQTDATARELGEALARCRARPIDRADRQHGSVALRERRNGAATRCRGA